MFPNERYGFCQVTGVLNQTKTMKNVPEDQRLTDTAAMDDNMERELLSPDKKMHDEAVELKQAAEEAKKAARAVSDFLKGVKTRR